MSNLPIKKIYCDTKFKRKGSKSTSNFKIDLPQTLKLPENCVCYIDDVSIPRTFYTVEEGVNDKLYFRLIPTNGTSTDYVITLSSKDYNGVQFAAEIQSKISSVTGGVVNTSYDAQSKQMSVSVANHTISFHTDEELKDLQGPYNYNTTIFNCGNELLTNVFSGVSGNSISNPAKYYLNLTPVRNIYMKSPTLSSFNTIGCNGESSIIKKIPVNASPGEMITSFITSATDFIPCNNLTLKTIEIQLEDVKGNEVNLHGMNMSFSILFDIMNSDQ